MMKNKEVKVPETRGAKPKYNFSDFKIGETRKFKRTYPQLLLTVAKNWVIRHKFDWKFRCYTMENIVYIVRVS